MHTTEKSMNFIFQAKQVRIPIHLHTKHFDNTKHQYDFVHKAHGYQNIIDKISIKYNCSVPKDAFEIISMTQNIDRLYIVGTVRDPFIFYAYEGDIYYYSNGMWLSRIHGIWREIDEVQKSFGVRSSDEQRPFGVRSSDEQRPFGVYEGEPITFYEKNQIAALILS